MSGRRTLFWVCFLGGAAALALAPEFFEPPPGETVEPVARGRPLAELGSAPAAVGAAGSSASSTAASSDGSGAMQAAEAARAVQAARGGPPATDLFAARSWQVAPAPPPAPVRAARPAPPVAAQAAVAAPPPMPFRFIGKLDQGEQLQVFLLRGTQLHVVKVGDVIDEQYRVDSISGTQMKLVFLPLQAAQTLTIGTAL